MCQFYSCIVTKNKIFDLVDSDSHEDIIAVVEKEGKFRFKHSGVPNYVRVEVCPMSPKNDSRHMFEMFKNIFKNPYHDLWCVKVDQDIVPDWWDIEIDRLSSLNTKDKYIQRIKKAFLKMYKKRIFIGKNCTGHVKLKNVRAPRVFYDTVILDGENVMFSEFYDRAQANIVYDASTQKPEWSVVQFFPKLVLNDYSKAHVVLRNNGGINVELRDVSTLEGINKSNGKLYVGAFGSSVARLCGNFYVGAIDRAYVHVSSSESNIMSSPLIDLAGDSICVIDKNVKGKIFVRLDGNATLYLPKGLTVEVVSGSTKAKVVFDGKLITFCGTKQLRTGRFYKIGPKSVVAWK